MYDMNGGKRRNRKGRGRGAAKGFATVARSVVGTGGTPCTMLRKGFRNPLGGVGQGLC